MQEIAVILNDAGIIAGKIVGIHHGLLQLARQFLNPRIINCVGCFLSVDYIALYLLIWRLVV